MSRIAVTDTGQLDYSAGMTALRNAGHEAVLLDTTDPAVVAAAVADCEALIVSFLPIDAAMLAALPRLRVIATTTVGVNRIDTAAARARGVDVCNLPSLASEEVAVHALTGMLTLIRELPESVREVRAGGWDSSSIPMPRRASELTLGLFGAGRIASRLAELATPLVAQVVAFDPFISDADWPRGVVRMSTSDELFAAADVLSLHAPATPETRGVVGARTLALMPPGSYLVNVARGDLVNESDLLVALESGQLRGAFLDVVVSEPPAANDVLREHRKVVVTPHTAFRSDATTRQYVMRPVEAVLAVLAGQRPENIVN